MMTRIGTFTYKLLRALINFIQRKAVILVLVTICLTLAAGWYVTSHFKINTNTSDMLSRDLPFRQLSQELDTAFPQLSDTLLIVIDGATPDLSDQATQRLANRMRRQPHLFGTVQDPTSDPFFHQHSLLYMDLTALERLSDRLARAQPFLSTLYREPTLKGLADMLVLALSEEWSTAGRMAAMPMLLNQMSAVVEALAHGHFSRLNWERVLLQGRDAAGSNPRRLLIVQPPLDFTTLHPARRAMVALHALAIELNLTPEHGVNVRLTGSVALSEEELESVESSIGYTNLMSLILILFILIMGIRKLLFIIVILVTLMTGLIITTALALFLIDTFNLISVAFAVLFIGLGVDFGIHVCLRYVEGIENNKKNIHVWATTRVIGPLTLTAMGTAIGFFSFLPTPYQGFAELGLIAGIGMFIALGTNLTVLPALLSLIPLHTRNPSIKHTTQGLRLLTWLVECHARTLTSMASVLVVLSIAFLPATRFDLDPLNLKDHETESVRTLRDLMQDERWTPQTIIMLADSSTQAHALAERLSHLPTVEKVSSIDDYVPLEQEEKRELINDMATFLSPLFMKTAKDSPSPLAVRQHALEALKQSLLTAPPLLERETRRLHAALDRIDLQDQTALQGLERALLATLPRQLELLRQGLQAGPVTFSTLPATLCTREMTDDGRTRIVIRPKEDLTDREALRLFVKTVQSIIPRATGTPVTLYESGQIIVKSFYFATFLTILVLLLLLLMIMRQIREILLIFSPIILSALLTNSLALLLGISYNFANMIALPLLFGIGIANSIQLVFRERLERSSRVVLRTKTPKAVILSTMTTITSFGSLALSTHPGTASMGLLLGISVAVTLIATLLILPAFMVTWPRPHPTGTLDTH